MPSPAFQLPEHPWESRALPRRPTRLVAVPSVRRSLPGRAPRTPTAPVLPQVMPLLRDVGETLAFLAILAVLLGVIGAVARVL